MKIPLEHDWSGQFYKAEEISSIVLQYMRMVASHRCQTEVRKAVITVPAYFNIQQKEATQNAARIAGLEVMRLINEPTAAAIAARLHEKSEP